MAVYLRLMTELDADGKHDSEQISEIDLTDPEDARVLLPEQGRDVLAHFGDEDFLERYQRYKAHIAEWRQQYPQLRSVDLRYENQVVLEMASGAEASTAPAGGTAAAAAAKTPERKPAKPAAKKSREQAKRRAAQRRAALETIRRNSAAKPGQAASAAAGE